MEWNFLRAADTVGLGINEHGPDRGLPGGPKCRTHPYRNRVVQTTNAHLQAILDNAQDAIITADTQSRIELAKPTATAMFGYDPAELIGSNLSVLIPEGYRNAHQQGVAQYLTMGRRRVIGKGHTSSRAFKETGPSSPCDFKVSENSSPDHRSFMGIIRDVSHIEQVNQKLSYQN